MNRLLLVVVFSISLSALAAQTKYVEVVVTDTVEVTVDYFVFRINATQPVVTLDTAGQKSDPNFIRNRAERQKQRAKDSRSDLEEQLKKNGFNTDLYSLADLNYGAGIQNNIYASTGSDAAVEYLIKLLKNEQKVSFNLLQVKSSSEPAAQTKLIQRLLIKAKQRANEIATLTGKKVMDIVSITEKKSETGSIASGPWGSGASLLNVLGPNRFSGTSVFNANYPLQNSITVKFSWQ